jgi:methionyl-tRNA synthetase
MTERYRQGELLAATSTNQRLRAVATTALADYRQAMDRFALHEGIAAAYRVIDAANLFIADTQPWVLARDESKAEQLTDVLAQTAEAVRIAAILLLPVMPGSAAEILRRMGETRPARHVALADAEWRTSGGKRILSEGPLWPRKELGVTNVSDTTKTPHVVPTVMAEPAAKGDAAPASAPSLPSGELRQDPADLSAGASAKAEADDRISIEDFMRVELRTAKVLEAERVPKSKRLMKMKINAGSEERTIVAGIAEAYEPSTLVGKTVVIVANLKPAKLMGIESNGMVLAASPDGGQPIVINAEPAEPGTRVR